MVRRRVGIAGLFGVVVALAPLGAEAQQKPTSRSFEYSSYEKETIARALAATGLQLDAAPEGKAIERIDTLRLEVLEDRDPIPDDVIGIPARRLLNSLHYVSRDSVIRREVLIKDG